MFADPAPLAVRRSRHQSKSRLAYDHSVYSGWPKRLHQNTPLKLTALPTDTVEVTDPTHPLYGLTFPLIGVTTKPRLGRVCVVWLYPGVERVIPVAATSLAGPAPLPPSPCRLSVAGLEALLAVVASLADPSQEEAHGDTVHARNAHATPTVAPVLGPGVGVRLSAARTPAPPPPARLDESLPDDPSPGTGHASTDSPGDTV